MSCGCNRPGHGPEPHSPVPLHAPLPSHSAIPLKGGSVFFNVIDHLKRQIDRLFKGKADLVDGKVPDDQLPERQVAWDDVKGKPAEFPPSAHGHEDLQQLIGGVSSAVTQLGGRVESAETAAASADSKAAAAKSIAEDAQASADDAVGYAELAVRTAESKASASELSDLSDYVDLVEERRDQNERSITRAFAEIATKLDSDGTAENSAKLGGVDASEYARKTDVPSRLKNDDDTERIDGSGNVYGVESVYDGGYLTDGNGRVYSVFEETTYNGLKAFKWTSEDNPGKYCIVVQSTGVVQTDGTQTSPIQALIDKDPIAGDVYPVFFAGRYFTHTNTNKVDSWRVKSQLLRATVDGKFTDAQKEELAETFALKSDLDAIRYPIVSVTNGQLVDRAVNVLTVSNNQTIYAPSETVKSYITYARDFVVRIEVGSTAPSGYSWGFTPEVKSGDSWDTLGLLEANKKYIYRFTDVGGSSLMAAREEVA